MPVPKEFGKAGQVKTWLHFNFSCLMKLFQHLFPFVQEFASLLRGEVLVDLLNLQLTACPFEDEALCETDREDDLAAARMMVTTRARLSYCVAVLVLGVVIGYPQSSWVPNEAHCGGLCSDDDVSWLL